MKNNMIIKKVFPCLLIAGIIISCNEEVLDTIPYGESTSAEFWRNGADANAASTAMYEPLRWEDLYGHSENVFDNCSDDIFRAGDHGYEEAMENFTFDPSNDGFRSGWGAKYEIVSRANSVLINVPGIEDIDAALKDRILGEAHFLRAFAYWRFSVLYGEVPLILEANTIEGNFNIPKSSLADIRAQVEADLVMAASLLPETHDAENLGRVNKGSANGLLAKLYLYEEEFQKSIDAGEEVIGGPYPLATNFRDNFVPETENNPEMLFSVQGEENWADVPKMFDAPRPWGGWDFHDPVENVVNEFEEGDVRLANSILSPGDMVDRGEGGVVEFTSDLTQTGYSLTKYANYKADGNLNGDQNVPVLRVADVYLLVAEAKIRLNGAGSGDFEINEVRRRAGLAPIENADMPELIHERRVELVGENQRHQDLMRWDKANIVDIAAIYAEDRGQFDPPRTFVRPKHYYFPIPQREIDLSNGVLIQNENY
ncbi:RagB/SusD family nutrient uptake outer membrane protein [Zobellia galactanivorans]|uniref:RagB/SusD family nutrient uptake outer membrane protein n=1 Tax=Zobellia TaxID=112040 RepID=UPI000B5319CA|nr:MULTISPECIES: RagB/SusD family nutrient uptake outer membrane protein [Zobellia]MDO6807186.1 RagB/SusD family nutrient uptake outer membrane protein [Zobellia galactanivorans]OWW27404.1 RagB/SusD family nutrient uptake outer membrane protein [Zobellia sp. OII3]